MKIELTLKLAIKKLLSINKCKLIKSPSAYQKTLEYIGRLLLESSL